VTSRRRELGATARMVAAAVSKPACSLNAAVGGWAPPVWFFTKFPKQLRFVNSKWMPSIVQKILKFCMRIDWSILNNFLNFADF
jgi:hypothetical protein